MRWLMGILGAMGVLWAQGTAWAAEPVAVLTEIRAGRGEVLVKLVGEADWKAPKLLLSLRAGDRFRATEDARAVVVFTGGQGTATVTQANSPFTIQAPAGEAASGKLQALLGGITRFLLGQPKDVAYRSLSVSKIQESPRIVSPRATRLLPGGLTFEWSGSRRLRYRVRLFGPQGLRWEQTGLPREPLAYPDGAPALSPGTRYAWEVEATGHPIERAQFELLPDADAARVRSSLALLEPARLSGYPRNTQVLMRAGLYYQEGLDDNARRELVAGIQTDPSEPTLYLLLGQVYDRVGLVERAAEAFEEAQALSTRKP